jgi:UDP-N-acetylglucosamine 2-epimerase (non-hydrolysing)
MYPDVELAYPVHLNPRVQSVVRRRLSGNPRIHLLPPLDYLDFLQVLQRCFLVLTDSGGLQEEAPALGKPVLVLREETERPEAVAAGTVRMVGTDLGRILAETVRLLDDPREYQQMARAVSPYGDGHAAERIVDILLDRHGAKIEALAESGRAS